MGNAEPNILSAIIFGKRSGRILMNWKPRCTKGAAQTADLERGDICRTEMGEQFGQAFPARNRGSGRPLPPFRNRIKLKKDDTSFLLTPNGVFFLALSHSIRHNLFHGHSLSTGRNFEVAPPLFWGKQKAGISSSLCIKIQFSTSFWSNRIKMLAVWALIAVPPASMVPSS